MSNVAITCDQLVFYDDSTEIVKQLCLLFPDAEVYTLAHKQGIDSSVIEQRKIHSSFLSHLVHSEKDFWKKSYLIPSAAKKVFVPCENKIIVNVSSGFSHCFSRCKESSLITYLFDEAFQLRSAQSFREKVFRGYLKNWSFKGLRNIDYLMTPNKHSSKSLEKKVQKVIFPPVKVSDYPLFSANQKKMLANNKLLIEASSMDILEAKKLCVFLKEREEKFLFVGNQAHLEELKQKIGEQYFFKSQCTGELAPLLAGARGLVVGSKTLFSPLSIKNLAVGGTLYSFPSYFRDCYLEDIQTEGFFKVDNLKDFSNILDKSQEFHIEGQKLRAYAMKFHDIKWNGEIKRALESL